MTAARTARIAINIFNRLDPGGAVQDFRDGWNFILSIFTPSSELIKKYDNDINKVLAKPGPLNKTDFISVANSCLQIKLEAPKRDTYPKYHVLQRLSEAMIHNFPPRPGEDALFRQNAINLRAVIG